MSDFRNYSVGCVVLNYNDSSTTINLLKQIQQYNSIKRIVVVDNLSTDDSFSRLLNMQKGNIDVIQTDHNGGYGYGNNYGVKFLRKKYKIDYAIIANPDVMFEEQVVNELCEEMENHRDCGVIAPIQLDKNGGIIKLFAWKNPNIIQTIFSAGYLFDKWTTYYYDKSILNVSSNTKSITVGCVPGAMLMVRTSDFIDIGGYDEKNFLFWEEDMLSLKMKKNFKVTRLLTESYYIHNHSVSINKNIPDVIKRTKILLNARYYFLKNYLSNNIGILLLAKIVFLICLLERQIVFIIKRH